MKAKVIITHEMQDKLCELAIKEVGVRQLQYLKELRGLYYKYFPSEDKAEWIYTQHFGFGMKIRNLFRELYTDVEIGGNWDDQYVETFNLILDQIKLTQIIRGGK